MSLQKSDRTPVQHKQDSKTGEGTEAKGWEQKEGEEHTFVPQTTVSIPHFPLSNLNQIKHSDAQPDIMENFVGVNRVDFVDERLVCWDTELVRFDRDSILPRRTAKQRTE